MAGMNLIFHSIAAIALLFLLYALMQVRAQRDFLRVLLHAAGGDRNSRRLVVDTPVRFLRRFAAAGGLECRVATPCKQLPCRIDPVPLFRLSLQLGLVRIVCQQSGVELYVRVIDENLSQTSHILSQALGGLDVRIVMIESEASAASGSQGEQK